MKIASEVVGNELLRAHHAGESFRPIADRYGITDIDSAYDVQAAFVGLLIEAGRTGLVGYKIGLTSARMQAMCGIDSPIAGVILADRVHRTGARVSVNGYHRLGLEFEIGVRIGRELAPSAAPFDVATVAPAVEAVCAAIELVDDRNADYRSLDVLSLVADNSWNAGIVLGDFRPDWPDLATVTGVIAVNGAEVDRGAGADVLGHPFAPLAWLANHLVARGSALRPGDIVLTGSLVTTRFGRAGEAYRYDVSGLGAVEVTLTES